MAGREQSLVNSSCCNVTLQKQTLVVILSSNLNRKFYLNMKNMVKTIHISIL